MQRKVYSLVKKENAMKTAYLILILFIFFVCDKPIKSDVRFTKLNIVQTSTPATDTNQNIVSTISVSGPELCYRFAYFTVNQQKLLVDIHVIGTYPTESMDCAQAIYNKVAATTAGKYVLRFFNGTQLFKSDTVQVN